MFKYLIALSLYASVTQAQSVEEIQFAKRLLADLQWRSFDANREFCGTIGIDRDGFLVASRPRRGWRNSCRPRDSWAADEIIASYHTHGAFTPASDSEIPSISDVEADMREGTDGWVSTPGGRMWFIDGYAGTVRQVCGLGCLPQDPYFEFGLSGEIPTWMTLNDLRAFFGE